MGFLTRALGGFPGLVVAKQNPVMGRPSGLSLGGFLSSGKGSRGDPDSYLRAYGDDPWVHGSVSTIAQSLAEVVWRLYEHKGDGDREEVMTEHPLKTVLNRPNSDQTGQDLIELSSKFELLLGRSYWAIVGGPANMELWLVPAGGMMPIMGGARNNQIMGYLYKVGIQEQKFGRGDIIPFVHTDPSDLLTGVGPTQPVALELDMHQYMRQYNRYFFYRNADPGTVIAYKNDVPQEELDRYASKYNAEHQGYGRSHGALFLSGDVTVTREGPSQRDMQFVQMAQNVRDTTLASYGLSYASLGGIEHGNRASTEGQIYRYMSNVIRPRLQFLRRKLNQYLVPRFGDNVELDFDDPTPENIEQQSTLVMARLAGGEISLEEARQELGQGEIQPSDHFLIPVNYQVLTGADILGSQEIMPPPSNGNGAKAAPPRPKAKAHPKRSGELISSVPKPTNGRS